MIKKKQVIKLDFRGCLAEKYTHYGIQSTNIVLLKSISGG